MIDDMTNDEKVKVINDLVADIDCLEPLHKWTNDTNIFSMLKLERVEIRHSNMLAWLLDPTESHGLNDKLLKKFLIYATKGTDITIMKGLRPVDVDLMDLDDAEVYREKNNIDILIISEKNQLVLAIENKIGTSEHSNQLEKYKTGLLQDYGDDYRFVLIYLTPNGEESSDLDNWVSMSYEFILGELNNLVRIYKIPEKARIYIEDYIKTIRRSVLEDKDIVDTCRKIYLKHKDAFDLIFENKPDLISNISDYIYKYLTENSKRLDINVWDNYTKHYIRFTPNKLTTVCGHMGSGWCNQTNLVGFEFYISEDAGVNLAVIIGPADSQYEDYRQKLFNCAVKHNFKMKGSVLRNKWKTILSTKFISKDKLDIKEENMHDTLEVPIESYMNKNLPSIVSDLLEAFK